MFAASLTTVAILVFGHLFYPVKGVWVEGARMYPRHDAWAAVPRYASLLTLNKQALQRKVESNPWVKSAKVYEDYSSGIVTVKVEERRPVLDARVDGREEVLALDGTRLPGRGGVRLRKVTLGEDQVGEALRFGRTLRDNGVRLDSVDAAGPGGIEATVEGRRVVFAGSVRADQARALPGIMKQNPGAPLLDLRSPGRVVVAGSSDLGAGDGSRG